LVTNEGRLACRDLGNGSEPVIVIFCFGGAGISWEDDEDESSDSSESISSSSSDSNSGLDFALDFDLEDGWEVWNRLSDDGRLSGSTARSFPFPLTFLEDDALPYPSA
jgi:hypothetical protein